MLSSAAAASASITNLVTAVGAAANTAAATSSWVQVSGYEGSLIIVQMVGTISTGTLVGKIRVADDGSGTNAADLAGATFTSVSTSTDAPNVQTLVIPATCGNYIQYVGTLSAGTSDLAVCMLGSKQSV